MNMPNALPAMERCPYLGLHDDPRTSLAYPSVWNYCYHAKPPSSISMPHQVAACLCPDYVRCPVYLAAEERALPPNLRGSYSTPVHGQRSSRKSISAIPFVILAIALILAFFFGRGFFSVPMVGSLTPLAASATHFVLPTATVPTGWMNPAMLVTVKVNTPTRIASQTPNGTALKVTPTRTATFTRTTVPTRTSSATPTKIPSHIPTASRTPTRLPASTPTGPTSAVPTCGHALDTPFGTDLQFVIHRVRSGENLTNYANQYQTTTTAILTVNYHLPMPVWADWIIVIPVGITDMTGIPPFEPYQAVGTSISLDELAKQLNTDSASLKKYNALGDSCKIFSGWLLVPR